MYQNCKSISMQTRNINKGGEQSPDFRTGGCHKTAPNGRNDLKFCMQGAFARLY